MTYTKGLVSVVIPTYKRSDMLTRAIDSVLGQTYQNIECLVVNDNIIGDEYSKVLYSLLEKYKADNRVKLIEQPKHVNGAAARNVGIRASQGEYIAFLDDDDYWHKEKVRMQVEELAQLDESWGAVSCMIKLYNNETLVKATLPYKSGYMCFNVITRRVSLGTGALIIRRSAIDDAGYWDENLFRFQDLQFFSYLTKKYKVKLIKKYLHFRDKNDAQNRPTVSNYEKLRDAFFASIKPVTDELPWYKRNVHKDLYNFESALLYWKNGYKKKAVCAALNVLTNPISFYPEFNLTVQQHHQV